MGASKEVFIRMREEEYNNIPLEVKEKYFNSHNITKETNDWQENMLDDCYSNLYKQKKEITKQLEAREYQLREQRRKLNNIEVNF